MTKDLMSVKLNKDPLIRTTFGEGRISEEHLVYAAIDAVATYWDAKSLIAQTLKLDTQRKMLGHRLQLQGDIAIGDMQQRPVHVDMERVKGLKHETER